MTATGDGVPEPRGMTRRQLMRHSAWFGAAVVLVVSDGELLSHIVGSADPIPANAALRFVQVSDSHIGFRGPANTDVSGSFSDAIEQVNGLAHRPDFVMHTGDLTHLATPAQFDQVKQMMTGLKTGQVFTVPGEHDSIDDAGQKYRRALGAGSRGDGWYSFDLQGVHFIALVNTLNMRKLGHLGEDQIDFVRKDVAGLSADTPIVVFSHIPLFALYPNWGWHGRRDAGTGAASPVLIGHVPQRAHPPAVHQDRRERHFPQRDDHRVSAAEARPRARSGTGDAAGRETPARARHSGGRLCEGTARSCRT
ncbi:metallophosphoesterase [Planotetraspora phitsanulokensis]|uniref:Calcineurin-like phosphoesterase domain-containing protein n=1 Tax=Planotetraspora phitsanulokensis TaxID=575192 RepID=A0A8J3XFF9_9ACTN|nr:metallophosphoesterase [Planotetraspora phitsanulokensis]GII38166.1 hypothetical protein Pph01_31690 [Planotetraspora phitsanulokensis]